jgi:hypothetical protein
MTGAVRGAGPPGIRPAGDPAIPGGEITLGSRIEIIPEFDVYGGERRITAVHPRGIVIPLVG